MTGAFSVVMCVETCAIQCSTRVHSACPCQLKSRVPGVAWGSVGSKKIPLSKISLCISLLELPIQLKADDSLTHMSKLFEEFCNLQNDNYVSLLSLKSLTIHGMGSSYCGMTHQILKQQILKIKRGRGGKVGLGGGGCDRDIKWINRYISEKHIKIKKGLYTHLSPHTYYTQPSQL